MKTAGATAAVEASYFAAGFAPLPQLTLTLTNGGKSAVTFTVRANNYSHAPAQTVPRRRRASSSATRSTRSAPRAAGTT